MPVVTVPFEFFEKERNTFYSNWQEAFFRELFQNSLDAGATTIRIFFLTEPEPAITFADNGCGMTQQVLEEVYFALGRTTKTDGSTVGGFGRARILTNFSMKKYKILTQNNMVEGSGAEYTLTGGHTFYPGCAQFIWPPEGPLSSPYRMKKALLDYLKGFSAACEVFIDGEKYIQNFQVGTYIRDLSADNRVFGKLHILEKKNNPNLWGGYLFVRVKGHPLFCRSVFAEDQFTVELDPAVAREVLSPNRDSFKGAAAIEFADITTQMSTNLAQMKRPRREYSDVLFAGRGNSFTRKHGFPESQFSRKTDYKPHHVSAEIIHMNVISRKADIAVPQIVNINEFLPNITFVVNCQTEDKLKAVPWWNPETWSVQIVKNRVDWKGNLAQFRVLMAWYAAVEFCLQTLMDNFSDLPPEIEWQAGFVINDFGVRAECEHDGIIYKFRIDPLKMDGTPAFLATDRNSLIEILALAKHEVAHVLEQNHNESYAKLLTGLDSYIDDERALVRMGAF